MDQKYARHLDNQLLNHFKKYRQILILLGARQVGKTTLLKRLFPDAQYFLFDNEPIREAFERYDINIYKQLIKPDLKTIVLDEIHLLTNPGRAAKIIYDQLPETKLIITGSSSLNLKNKTSESLAGRKIDYHLYPLTFSEYLYQKGIEESLNYNVLENIIHNKSFEKVYSFDMQGTLIQVLAFGLYPELINSPNDKNYLQNLADSVIFKDILELDLIEKRNTALNILKLLAYQIGSLVNYSEIASRLNVDVRTVRRYINIFEQSFIIFKIPPFLLKKRDEIGKSVKIYFYDLGIRNALINDFSSPILRNDLGAVFENFIIAEILKINSYTDSGYALNYWRTKQGAEVDLVLSKKDKLIGLEIKYKSGKVSKSFSNRYPQAEIKLVTSKDFY